MSTYKQEKEVEVIKTFEYGRFKVTVSQIKMTGEEREVENSRIRKQFMCTRF
ncbi:MAG: hypothetical protein HFJ44_08230 [Clostridia bacterium]|uniref:hypothetical protein n=1 Tax=Oscillibacter sp. TaxID=1945593 RepID=UPI00217191B5|nr:hypothetical protein [Oscillibacter sp.]MCI8547190.1 hypothetical protein [Clostridia bacterium]MCI9112998.1 hypothetical protein [Oscillibacter sp.]